MASKPWTYSGSHDFMENVMVYGVYVAAGLAAEGLWGL
jgi:hypothetical protein